MFIQVIAAHFVVIIEADYAMKILSMDRCMAGMALSVVVLISSV
jgi:hypothetical protein